MNSQTSIDPAALALIVDFETGGRGFYESVYKSRPCWPGGRSGVTIGCGYDLGYERGFAKDWAGKLSPLNIARLKRCLGKVGSQGRQALSGVRDIEVPWELAMQVFSEKSVPQQIAATLRAFPGAYAKLPAKAFGALVSLVYNRGELIDDSPRRDEMFDIRVVINRIADRATPEQLRTIAALFRRMKRLWQDDPKSDGDLVDRREAEARLIESAIA